MKKYKNSGLCPFCKKMVRAEVVEENNIMRDVCKCPSCGGRILICRAPGCDNYAEGGSTYDEELCGSCTSTATKMGLGVAAFIIYLTTGKKPNNQ